MRCTKCDKEMEKGFLRQSWLLGGGLGMIGANLYWCKELGFWKARDKVNLNMRLSGIGSGNTIESYICKNCKVISFGYDA